MRRSALLFLAVATAAAPAPLAAQELLGQRDAVFTLSERVADGAWVRVFSRSGTITVSEATGSTLEFRGEKDVRRGDREDIAFIVHRGSNGITICAIFSEDDRCDEDGLRSGRSRWRNDGRNRARVNITVSVPRGARLHTTTGNGDVSVNAATAAARVASGNGKVRVAGVRGEVTASSGNGEVTVERVEGPVRATTGNGDVYVTATNGPVNASSGNGDIRATMDRLSGNDDLVFTSGNGRIEVTVPADFSAEVEAHSGNGRIVTDFPVTVRGRLSPSRLQGTIGRGGRRLRMTTGNGSMEIRKR